jgi:hypothetical protein
LAVKKRTLLTSDFITVLLLSALAGTHFVNSGRANPYLSNEWVSPPDDAEAALISIHPFRNNTVYALNNLSLSLNVSIPESKYSTTIYDISYKRDWKDTIARIYHRPSRATGLWTSEYSYNLNLTEIPEGNHNVTFIVNATGGYAIGLTAYSFSVTNISVMNFTIDTTPPKVYILSLENKTYDATDVPLYFTVNEPVSRIVYSLDGQENVTINGNTTLPQLSYGAHTITVYATDNAGNTGTSETIAFNIAEKPEPPFPTAQVAAASASIVVIGVGLLVYFKKRKH